MPLKRVRQCPECGRIFGRGHGKQCLLCEREFHTGCLVRVKLNKKHYTRPYMLCKKCKAANPRPNRQELKPD